MKIDPKYPTLAPEALAALEDVKKELEAQAPEGAAPDPNEAEASGDDGAKDAKGKGKGRK